MVVMGWFIRWVWFNHGVDNIFYHTQGYILDISEKNSLGDDLVGKELAVKYEDSH